MFVGDGRGTVKGPLLMVRAGHFGGGGGWVGGRKISPDTDTHSNSQTAALLQGWSSVS